MEKSILVPFDFSNEANFALEHAYEISRFSKLQINLLYVVNSESEEEEWLNELEKVAKKFSLENDCKVSASVRTGNLYETIYDYGIKTNAHLAVMGTHGITTIKRAMRVIKKFVKIPFVLIQRPISFGTYNKICVPIDSNKNSRAKFLWVRYLSHFFESKVFIVYRETKNPDKRKSLNSNLMFATSIFEEDAIEFDVKEFPEENFSDALFDYMNTIEPDIALYMTDEYKDIVLNLKHARNIELSKKIPIMCVNPRTDLHKHGGFSH